MRLFSIALCLATSAAAAQQAAAPKPVPAKPAPLKATAPAKPAPKRADVNASTAGAPELPKPFLKLAEGPSIDGRAAGIGGLRSIFLGPGGQMAVEVGFDGLQVFDSTGKQLWKIAGGNPDLGSVTNVGWQGSQMWVYDNRLTQIALIDHGAVTKSLEVPTWIRPTWANRKAFPVFGYADIRALFPDGSMIVLPYRAHSVVGTTGYDSTMEYVVRVGEGGLIQKTIAKFPSLDAANHIAFDKAQRTQSEVPDRWLFGADYWPRVRVSTDGLRTVVVSVDTTDATMDSVVVSAFTDQGQPRFTARFGIKRQAFSQHDIDSIAALRFHVGDAPTRARQKRGLARKLPSVRDVVIGRDYSVWVTMLDVAGAKPIVGIDPTGKIIGTAFMPATLQLKAADGQRLWIADYRNTFKDIVRYTIIRP